MKSLRAQKPANILRFALAANELLIVAQCNQPRLAAKSAHLPHVIDVHQRIPVDSPEAGICETLLEDFQRTGSQVLSLCSDDPDQVLLSLESIDFVSAQQEVLLAKLPNDLRR